MRGGLIDARLVLGLRLSRRAEAGPAIAPDGALIGLAVSGPRRQVLVIPASTIQRACNNAQQQGYVARG